MKTYIFNVYVFNHHGSTERRWYRVRCTARAFAGHLADAKRNADADKRTSHVVVAEQAGDTFVEVARF